MLEGTGDDKKKLKIGREWTCSEMNTFDSVYVGIDLAVGCILRSRVCGRISAVGQCLASIRVSDAPRYHKMNGFIVSKGSTRFGEGRFRALGRLNELVADLENVTRMLDVSARNRHKIG